MPLEPFTGKGNRLDDDFIEQSEHTQAVAQPSACASAPVKPFISQTEAGESRNTIEQRKIEVNNAHDVAQSSACASIPPAETNRQTIARVSGDMSHLLKVTDHEDNTVAAPIDYRTTHPHMCNTEFGNGLMCNARFKIEQDLVKHIVHTVDGYHCLDKLSH